MIILTGWGISKCRTDEGVCNFAHGTVSGHPKLQDGIYITTSPIEKIDFDDKKNQILFRTRSQNDYSMDLREINFQSWEDTVECLEKMNVTIPSEEECLKLAEKLKAEKLKKVSEILKDNELYLKMSGLYVQKAFWKKGEIREIGVREHIGMFQDSYLITDWDKGEVDFRYFDRLMSIEPYHYSDGLETIYIDNVGTEDFLFRDGETEILCKSGEITTIGNKYFKNEGLFSPDVVTGKSLSLITGEEWKSQKKS